MDEFFSWQMLATFAGATAATLCAATAAIGDFTEWTSWAILPLNAALVSMASNGAFAAVKRAAEGKSKTE